MDQRDLAEVILCLYAACACASGDPGWLDRANRIIEGCSDDPETSPVAADLLSFVAFGSRHLSASPKVIEAIERKRPAAA